MDVIKHKLATLFLWSAHKLEPKWVESLLKVKETEPLQEQAPPPSPDQTNA